jgi:hypothetical protein
MSTDLIDHVKAAAEEAQTVMVTRLRHDRRRARSLVAHTLVKAGKTRAEAGRQAQHVLVLARDEVGHSYSGLRAAMKNKPLTALGLGVSFGLALAVLFWAGLKMEHAAD